MTYDELVLWAKKWGYHVETKRRRIIWWKEPFCSKGSWGTSVSSVATDIFNHITNDEWVEYQEEYAREQANTDIHLEPPI